MALLVDKWHPKTFEQMASRPALSIHPPQIIHRLKAVLNTSGHICLYGPPNVGKKTLLVAALCDRYGPSVFKVQHNKRTITLKSSRIAIEKGKRVKKTRKMECEIETTSSDHHIELTPFSLGGPTRDYKVMNYLLDELCESRTEGISSSTNSSSKEEGVQEDGKGARRGGEVQGASRGGGTPDSKQERRVKTSTTNAASSSSSSSHPKTSKSLKENVGGEVGVSVTSTVTAPSSLSSSSSRSLETSKTRVNKTQSDKEAKITTAPTTTTPVTSATSSSSSREVKVSPPTTATTVTATTAVMSTHSSTPHLHTSVTSATLSTASGVSALSTSSSSSFPGVSTLVSASSTLPTGTTGTLSSSVDRTNGVSSVAGGVSVSGSSTSLMPYSTNTSSYLEVSGLSSTLTRSVTDSTMMSSSSPLRVSGASSVVTAPITDATTNTTTTTQTSPTSSTSSASETPSVSSSSFATSTRSTDVGSSSSSAVSLSSTTTAAVNAPSVAGSSEATAVASSSGVSGASGVTGVSVEEEQLLAQQEEERIKRELGKRVMILVIHDAHQLSTKVLASLRRKMEMGITYCQIVLITHRTNVLMKPIMSRCSLLRVPAPGKEKIRCLLSEMLVHEQHRQRKSLEKIRQHRHLKQQRQLKQKQQQQKEQTLEPGKELGQVHLTDKISSQLIDFIVDDYGENVDIRRAKLMVDAFLRRAPVNLLDWSSMPPKYSEECPMTPSWEKFLIAMVRDIHHSGISVPSAPSVGGSIKDVLIKTRAGIEYLLQYGIDPLTILRFLSSRLMAQVSNEHPDSSRYKSKMIQAAAECDVTMSSGNNPAWHIEAFVATYLSILKGMSGSSLCSASTSLSSSLSSATSKRSSAHQQPEWLMD